VVPLTRRSIRQPNSFAAFLRVILPKIANVIAGCVALGLLLFVRLPRAVWEWKQSEQRAQDLTTLAAVDPLTGIYNRRQFETLAQAKFDRAQRYMRPVSVLIVDIDYFKRHRDGIDAEQPYALERGRDDVPTGRRNR
jgi:predicted signal transduction protein with EAL and GGDEF domain